MPVRSRLQPFLLTALLIMVAACGGEEGPGEAGAAMMTTIPSVEVIQARYGSLPLEERLTGVVHAKNQITIFAEISAPVVRVAAQNGDYVRQGDALVYLRDKQYTDQLRQVEAALEISRADANRTDANLRALKTQVERARQLAERQYQSAQELESLEAQLSGAEAGYQQSVARIAEAEANVEEQREAVRRTVVRAPISGYVGLKNAEVGMRADPGTPLYTIGNFDEVRVEVSISDRMVNSIKVGDTALIRLDDESGGTVEATVSRISPFLESGSYSATAEIDVRNTDGLLRPGMFVAVDVLYGETNQATLVPESALYEDPRTGQMGIYVATSLRTETPIEEPETYDPVNPPPLTDPTPMAFTPVDVLARGRGVAGVAGLQLGDWVIVIGQNLIRPVDGQTVARARPVTWERIAALQGMQDEDLLRQFMDKQQRLARETFSSPTSSAAPAAMNESATAPGGATAAD
jgi:RND family efflux transporter MFP subunit